MRSKKLDINIKEEQVSKEDKHVQNFAYISQILVVNAGTAARGSDNRT